MRADEHDLVGLVGPRDLADDVEAARLRLLAELHLDVELDLDRHVVLEQPHHPVVVLDGERDLRKIGVRRVAGAAAGLDEDRPAVHALRLPRRDRCHRR